MYAIFVEGVILMNIGILDDNQLILDYLTVALGMVSHTVQTYTSSSSLLEAVFSAPIRYPRPHDLLIIDLCLPGNMSGQDVITAVHQRIHPEILPIILMSGASEGRLQEVQASFPYVPILPKPFKLQTLLRVIEKLKPESSFLAESFPV